MKTQYWTIIDNDVMHQKALDRLIEISSSGVKKDSEEYKEKRLLSLLIKDYEDRTIPPVTSNPIDIIKYYMDMKELKQSDLINCFGSASRVSEVLNGKRKLTLTMIRNLNKYLGINYNLLFDNEYIEDEDNSIESEFKTYINKFIKYDKSNEGKAFSGTSPTRIFYKSIVKKERPIPQEEHRVTPVNIGEIPCPNGAHFKI